jgi:hypothetical protein
MLPESLHASANIFSAFADTNVWQYQTINMKTEHRDKYETVRAIRAESALKSEIELENRVEMIATQAFLTLKIHKIS